MRDLRGSALQAPLSCRDGVALHALKVKQMAKPTEEQIRQRAHEIWEENHRPDGRDEEFWLQAERELGQATTPDEKSNPDEKSKSFLE
jgi:hypothetical protein